MLAPLENRSLIEREMPNAPEERMAQQEKANRTLAAALRQSRQTQRRNATLAARKIVAQTNEISRLQTLLRASQERVAALESGQAIVELGQRLMALGEANERLSDAARRIWALDKHLCAAHEECARLADERDRALYCLQRDADSGLKHSD